MSEAQQQIALVTGASRGIGAAIALHLAQLGYVVIGTATSDDGAAKISLALSAFPGSRGATLNVNDAEAGAALIDAIVKEHGGLQVLVNNAGITRDQLAMRMKDDDWDAVLDTNLKAVFRMSRAVMRPMMKQRFGMTRALARELGSRNITVNCVAPGFIETDMTASLPEEQQKALLGQIPLGHLGQAEDIAHAVAYLAGTHAGYVTGQELHVNGGMFMA